MKRFAILGALCASMLVADSASTVLGATRSKRVRRVKKKPKIVTVLPITEVSFYSQEGGGGRWGGSGHGWTLRSNGTALQSLSPSIASAEGGGFTPESTGTFRKDGFPRLAAYIRNSGLLEATLPKVEDDGSGSLSLVVVRGGQRKRMQISKAARPSRAEAAFWVTRTLIEGMVADTDWKNAAGHSIDTGIGGYFSSKGTDGNYLNLPTFAILNSKSEEVGTASSNSESQSFEVVLPPGEYRLAAQPFKSGSPQSDGRNWSASPATVVVLKGSFTPVAITMKATPTAP